MRVEIVYHPPKKTLFCPFCKTDAIEIVFFDIDLVNPTIHKVEQNKILLVRADVLDPNMMWKCNRCYDIGHVIT